MYVCGIYMYIHVRRIIIIITPRACARVKVISRVVVVVVVVTPRACARGKVIGRVVVVVVVVIVVVSRKIAISGGLGT